MNRGRVPFCRYGKLSQSKGHVCSCFGARSQVLRSYHFGGCCLYANFMTHVKVIKTWGKDFEVWPFHKPVTDWGDAERLFATLQFVLSRRCIGWLPLCQNPKACFSLELLPRTFSECSLCWRLKESAKQCKTKLVVWSKQPAKSKLPCEWFDVRRPVTTWTLGSLWQLYLNRLCRWRNK